MKGHFITMLFLLAAWSASSQEVPSIIPPSPTAAALGKYGDIPVSLYTGIPSVDIPLYTLSGSHLKLPISLSYHASGLKVEENASWVGLGFSLNAGGVITRTTRSLRDEVSGQTKGYLTNDPIPDAPDVTTYFGEVIAGNMDTEPDIFFFNFNGRSGKFFLAKKEANSNVIKGHSIPYNDLEITCIYQSDFLSQFTIRTEDGTEYFFNSLETTTSQVFQYDVKDAIPILKSDKIKTAISGWYLTEIRSPVGGEVITFSYAPEKFRYDTPKRGEVAYKSNGQMEFRRMSYSQNTIDALRLQSIRFAKVKTTIEFEATKVRTDLISFQNDKPMALEEIIVKHDLKPQPLHKFELVTSYFRNHLLDLNLPPIPQSDHYQYQRLRLDQVVEWSEGGALSHPPYVFDYNMAMIPPKNAETQDHWGFYNGPEIVANASQYYSSHYMMPAFYGEIDNSNDRFAYRCNNFYLSIPVGIKSYQKVPGVSREPNSGSMQVSILKRITYPTGGTTELTFEPHRYGYVADKPYEKINYAKFTPSAIIERPWDTNPTQDETKTTAFTVAEDGLYKINFSVEYAYKNEIDFDNGWAYTRNEVSLEGDGLEFPHVRIYWDNYDGNTADIYSAYWDEDLEFPTTVPVTTLATGSIEYEGRLEEVFDGDGNHFGRRKATGFFIVKLKANRNYTLTSQRKYEASLHCPDGGTCYENNNESVIFFDKEIETGTILNYDKQILAGGLRIKNVTSLDGFGGGPSSKEYSYMVTDGSHLDTDRSSGCLLTLPKHSKLEVWAVEEFSPSGPPGYDPSDVDFFSVAGCMATTRYIYTLMSITSDYPMPLSTTQGSHIGYREVRVRQGGNGSTITKFLSGFEHPDRYPDRIILHGKDSDVVVEGFLMDGYESQYQVLLPQINYDWKRGFEDSNFTLTENNVLLLEEKNHYTFQERTWAEGLQVIWSGRDPYPPYALLRIQSARYRIISGWGYLDSKTTTEHTPLGNIVKTITYTHDSPAHIQVTKEVHRNSDDKTEEIKYFYVADRPALANTPASIFDQMNDKNMIYRLAKKEARVNGVLVSGLINNFKLEEGNLVPSSQELYENGYKERLKFNKYNASGSLLQYTVSGNVPNAFIWDNTGTQPLAKVVNANWSSIFFEGFEETGTLQDVSNQAKTGNRYLNSGNFNFLTNGNFNPPDPSSLKLSYWYWNPTISKWEFKEREFTNVISDGTRLDEIRVYPEGAQMTTYSYDPLIGLVSQTDSNNISQYFEYDKYGRLEFIRDEQENIIKKYTYHYSGE